MTNIRFLIGKFLSTFIEGFISNNSFPLIRGFPYNISAFYDIQRIIQTRDLDVIIDVGANEGQTLKTILKYFPKAQIHCFEPASFPYSKLKLVAAKVKNVEAHQVALGENNECLSMKVSNGPNSELNTLLENSAHAEKLGSREDVSVITLDQFINENEVSHINLLKIDAQGFEEKILKGAKNLLKENLIDFILIEVSFSPDLDDMIKFTEIHKEMISNKFVLSGLYDLFRWGNKNEVYFGNALYTNVKIARPDI